MFSLFVVGAIIYVASVSICYIPSFKSTNWYYPVGLLLAFIANALWLTIAKSTNESDKLLLYGLYWDIMLTFVYAVVPIALFGAKLGMIQMFGVGLIGIGILLVKGVI